MIICWRFLRSIQLLEWWQSHIEEDLNICQCVSQSVSQSVCGKDQVAARNSLSKMEMLMHGPVRRNTPPGPRSDFKNTRLVLDWPGAPDYRTESINIVIYVTLYAHPAAGSLIKGLPTSCVATRLVNQLSSVANKSKTLSSVYAQDSLPCYYKQHG